MVGLVVVVGMLACGAGPARGQAWAEKMFQVRSHDFGAVARGATAEFVFEFENIYKEDVHVASVRSSCGCTSPSVRKADAKTFEKGEILAKYNTRSFLGRKSATVTVVFDRPFYAEVQLSVSGHIRSDIVFDPGEVNFGEIEESSPAEQVVRLDYAGRQDWTIQDVRSASDHLEVELNEKLRSAGRVQYEMLVRLKPTAPAGFLQEQLVIVTDDRNLQTVPILVQGKITSPLTVGPQTLDFGSLKPGESATKQLLVRGKTPFRVVKVECEGDCLQFTPPGDEAKSLHFIPVTFTAGENPGAVTQKIRIETDLGSGVCATCIATAHVTNDN